MPVVFCKGGQNKSGSDTMQFNKAFEKLKPELIALRRDFHMYPELGFEEFRTQKKIIAYLENIDIEAKKIATTGVVGVLSGKRKGKTLLIRSDMDALPVQEETGLTFRSRNKGVMHACGHDGHMAMLLVAAKLLVNQKKDLRGKIIFAFQPNEEDAGAYKMIEEGILKNNNVDAAFGCHLWNQLETGCIDISDGPIMAASHYFSLVIRGRGGHAGFAHESIDPIFVSSQVIQAVQSIQTRQINALQPAVIIFTHIQGGANSTTIPQEVLLQGSIRFLHPDGVEIISKFDRMVKDICHTHDAAYDLRFKIGNHILFNDPAMAGLVRQTAHGILNEKECVTADIKTMAGEDFSEFAHNVPSAFAFVGAKKEVNDERYPHHHPKFDMDEGALVLGTALYYSVALEYLKEAVS
jgi:amidohydrolase